MRLFFLTLLILGHCSILSALELTVHAKHRDDPFEKKVTASTIEQQQYRKIETLLNSLPGVIISKEGTISRVSIRGAKTGQTLVLVNGIPVNDPADPSTAFDFGDLELESIEELKVYTGAEALEFGSAAIGGVIAITTKKGRGPTRVKGRIEQGTSKSTNGTISLQGSQNAFDYYASLSGKRFGRGSRHNSLHGNTVSNFDKDYNANTRLGRQLHKHWYAELLAQGGQHHYHIDGFPNFPQSDLPEEVGRRGHKNSNLFTLKNHVALLNQKWIQTLDIAQLNQKRYYTYTTPIDGQRTYLSYESTYKYNEMMNILAATGWQQDTAKNTQLHKNLEHSYLKLKGEWLINQHHRFTLSGRLDKTSKTSAHKTVQATLGVQLIPTMILKTSFGTGFRAPSINDVFGFPPFQQPNFNLKPEQSQNFDLGFENDFQQGKFKTLLMYFYNRIHHIIVWDPGLQQVVNRDRRLSQGLESKLIFTPNQAWTLSCSYTLTRATDHGPKQTVIRQPKHKLTLNVGWQITTDWQCFGDLTYESATHDKTLLNRVVKLPATTQLRVGSQYQLNSYIAVFGRLENLLDQKREKIYGYGRIGRGFFVGIKAAM